MTGLTLRALPDLSYDRIIAPPDPEPARTDSIRRAIRQALLAEAPLDLLHDDMKGFATDQRFAAQCERLHDVVARVEKVEYLRSEPAPSGGYTRHLYRYTTGVTTSYFTVGWKDGTLFRLRYEDN